MNKEILVIKNNEAVSFTIKERKENTFSVLCYSNTLGWAHQYELGKTLAAVLLSEMKLIEKQITSLTKENYASKLGLKWLLKNIELEYKKQFKNDQ